jgi:hypothetical protein
MINDYECPRCHNRFPSQNVVMHDRMCTEGNPMPLDKSRRVEIKESNNSNNDMQVSNSNVKISQEKPPEEIKNSQNSESIPNIQESQLKKSSQSGEFPEIFTCEICHEVLPESERKDHMYCHDLQNEENNAPNNEDEFRITQSQIDNQKEIERQIKRENEERRQQQNQRNQERRRNENQAGNNRNNSNNRNVNVNINNNLNNMDEFFEDFSNFNINNNQNRNNPSRGNGVRQMRIIIGGPNGPRVVQQFSSNDNGNMNINDMDAFNMFFNNNSGMRSQRTMIPYMNIINRSFGFNFDELIERLRNRDNPTDQEILNELPETKIEDVNKLDPEKKNCVICLEDFKNGDKATVLPCIHLFHTTCIQNWLKTQNSCPICKFKLTGENINSQH